MTDAEQEREALLRVNCLERKLAAAGQARRGADKIRSDASSQLQEVVLEALADGMNKSQIAQAAGVSRQAIYDLISKP